MTWLDPLLGASRADDAFKADVVAYHHHRAAARIVVERHAPRVKVLRVIAQLLAVEPALRVERVRVDGTSGCCDFRGTLVVECADGPCRFDFVWDCRWRAVEEGWVDRWGGADQTRAAREFGWQCFATWRRCDEADDPAPRRRAPLDAG